MFSFAVNISLVSPPFASIKLSALCNRILPAGVCSAHAFKSGPPASKWHMNCTLLCRHAEQCLVGLSMQDLHIYMSSPVECARISMADTVHLVGNALSSTRLAEG